MTRFIPAPLAFIILFSPLVSARDSVHTGYWRATDQNPSNGQLACQGVMSESEMINILEESGWSEEWIPDIDWKSDEAVIIAQDKDLEFYGLFDMSGEIILSYGLRRDRSEISTFASGGGGTTAGSGGSSAPSVSVPPRSDRSIIVISHKRGLDADQDFFCQKRLP